MASPDDYSVVIPAYNAELFIGEALESILTQSRGPVRVIVVNDGSTDLTAEKARGFGPAVTVLQQPNRGPGAATSRGMDAVDTPLLAFLDADDRWLPGKAERQLNILSADSDIDGVFGHWLQIQDGQQMTGKEVPKPGLARTTMMVRTKSARRIGKIVDPPGGHGEMIDWLARGRELGAHFELMDDIVAIRRVHPGSLTYRRSSRDRGYLTIVKAALDRRRAAAS